MFTAGGFVPLDALGAARPELTAGFGVDQPDDERVWTPVPRSLR